MFFSSSTARNCSWILRFHFAMPSWPIQSVNTEFFKSCCVIVDAPCEKLPLVMPSTPARMMPWMSMPLCS